MYNGGKNHPATFQFIINQIPPHRVYIEPFLGSGAIIKNKKPAEINIGIELDQQVINTFHTGAEYLVVNSCSLSCMKLIAATAEADTFIYLDPPYPKSSRRNQKDLYNFEMTDEQHIELLSTIRTAKCMVCISTYPGPLYKDMLHDWRVVSFEAQTRQGSATELLYMNYPVPEALHDYSFLGDDKTHKQMIRRKIEREIRKLNQLPIYERQAITEAVVKMAANS